MYPLGSEHEVLEKLELFLADVGKPQTLVLDGALEFKSRGFSCVQKEWHSALVLGALHSANERQD